MGFIEGLKRAGSLAPLLAAVHPHDASAAAGSCTIAIVRDGVLKPNAQLTTLSTKNAGGQAARATITASASGVVPGLACSLGLPLNCMEVSITPPTSFSAAPSGGGTSVVMVNTFS